MCEFRANVAAGPGPWSRTSDNMARGSPLYGAIKQVYVEVSIQYAVYKQAYLLCASNKDFRTQYGGDIQEIWGWNRFLARSLVGLPRTPRQ